MKNKYSKALQNMVSNLLCLHLSYEDILKMIKDNFPKEHINMNQLLDIITNIYLNER